MRYGRPRGHRGREAYHGLPPSGPSEKQLRIQWYGDRLRRAQIAMEAALDEARIALQVRHADDQIASLKKIVAGLEQAVEAEKSDANR